MTSSSTIVLIVAWVFGAGRFGLSTTNLTSDEPQPQSYQTDIAGMSHLLLCTRGAGAALTMPVMRIDVMVRTSLAPARGGRAETAGARAASQPQQQLDVTMAGGYGLWPVSPHVSLGLHDAMGACVSAYDSLARTHALRECRLSLCRCTRACTRSRRCWFQ